LRPQENIIDGRLNAQYHELEDSARQGTSPRRLAVGRSQAVKAIASGFLRNTLAISHRKSFLFNI